MDAHAKSSFIPLERCYCLVTVLQLAKLDLTIQTYLLLLEAFINIQLDYDELLVTDLVGIFGLTAHLS